MIHHLVVYVFHLTGNKSKCSEMDATVLARHKSPGFSLVSFRRSGNYSRDAGCDLPAIDVANSNKYAAVGIDSPDVGSSPSDDLKIDVVDRLVFEPSYQKKDVNRSEEASQGQHQYPRNRNLLKLEIKEHHQLQPEIEKSFEIREPAVADLKIGQHLLIDKASFSAFLTERPQNLHQSEDSQSSKAMLMFYRAESWLTRTKRRASIRLSVLNQSHISF